MIRFRIVGGLPFVSAQIQANGKTLVLNDVLIDTGSAASVFRTDDLETIGAALQPEDRIRYMRGIGGLEPVVERVIDQLQVDNLYVVRFRIQLGALNYGTPMNGILGSDFLLATGAKIDYQNLTISK